MSNIKFCAFADEASPSLDLQIKALQRNGLEYIEVRGVDGKNVSALNASEAADAAKRLADGGIKVWSIGSPVGKYDIKADFSIECDTMKRTLETASILGAENIRMFSFYNTANDDLGAVIDRIGTYLELAAPYNVTLCHENEKGIFGDVADRCLKLHQTFKELSAVFDPANFVQCGEDTVRAWNMLKPYVKYLHAKDSRTDGKVVPCGDGAGNVKYIFDEYSAMGGGVITVEPHLKSFIGLAALEKESDASVVGAMNFASADEAFDYAISTAKKLVI